MTIAVCGATSATYTPADPMVKRIVEYRSFSERFSTLYASRTMALAQVLPDISSLASNLALAASLQGRVKSLDSTWRKMRENRIHSDQVLDAIGVRVIVPRISDCYLLVEPLCDLFEVTTGTHNDYIEHPKPNGYRSLHTTIIVPSGHTVEVQIRTPWMHALAEWGAAAHWRYKQRALPLIRGELPSDKRALIGEVNQAAFGVEPCQFLNVQVVDPPATLSL